MAINPLEIYPTPAGYAASATGTSSGLGAKDASVFDTLLGALAGPRGGVSAKGQQVAADLLRIEMMQSSLSLSGQVGGEGERSASSGLKVLESMLASFAANRPAAAAAQGRDGGVAVAAASTVATAGEAASAGLTGEADAIGKTAARFLGTPYRFGGEGPTGIDCSSFVQQVFREHQVELPRTAREQSRMGSEVAVNDLAKGDLVFFQTYASYPSHVGIYLGDGKMIHASSGKGEVTVSDLNSDYYRSRFLGARRVA